MMEKRIEALEAKYKRLKSTYFLAALTVVAMFAMGQTTTSQPEKSRDIIADSVTANKYLLVDENGSFVGLWTGKSGGAQLLMFESKIHESKVELNMFESKDNLIMMSVGLSGHRTTPAPSLRLQGDHNQIIEMKLIPNSRNKMSKMSMFRLQSEKTSVYVTAGDHSSGLLVGMGDKSNLFLGGESPKSGTKNSPLGLSIVDEKKNVRVSLRLYNDDRAYLIFLDEKGESIFHAP